MADLQPAQPPRGWREGDPTPPRLSGNDLPADATLGADFRDENDSTNVMRFFYPRTVHYMPNWEREECRLFVDAEGRLRSAKDRTLFDTARGVSPWDDESHAIFVMDGSGNLYATLDFPIGRVHHSSLLAGAPVVGAGEIKVRAGRLLAMNRQSGHYQPTTEMNALVMQTLIAQGLRPDPDFTQM